jgi:Bifunctional DNA primase/polymerase, N-terminal
MATASSYEIALKAHERFGALPIYEHDIQFIPLTDDYKQKKPADGFLPRLHVIPKNPNGIALMAGVYSDSNLGIRSRRQVGALMVIDIDEPGTKERIEREYGPLPLSYTTQTRPVSRPYKQHVYFLQTEYSVATFHKQVTDVTHTAGYDLKCNGGWGYVAAEGSIRDSEIVTALHDVPMIPIPDSLVDFLRNDTAGRPINPKDA